jgi:ferritin-like protein
MNNTLRKCLKLTEDRIKLYKHVIKTYKYKKPYTEEMDKRILYELINFRNYLKVLINVRIAYYSTLAKYK